MAMEEEMDSLAKKNTLAVDDTDSEKWKMAMEEEMDSLAKKNTWDLVELPEGRSVVGCKWVFTRLLFHGKKHILTKKTPKLTGNQTHK